MKSIFTLTFFLFLGLSLKGYSQTVYASDKGEKYHTADCKLSGDAKDITLTAAKKAGKGPCGICKPDVAAVAKQCSGKTADGIRCKRMTASKAGRCYQQKTS